MCNFYIMYYTEVKNNIPFNMCMGNNVVYPPIMQNMPADSDKPLPSNPLLEEMARGHHHHHGMGGESNNIQTPPVQITPQQNVIDNHNLPPIQTKTGNRILPPIYSQKFEDNYYPRDYETPYDYYNPVEMQRSRKRYPVDMDYDPYDDGGLGRYATGLLDGNMDASDWQRKSRNRNKVFDAMSKNVKEVVPRKNNFAERRNQNRGEYDSRMIDNSRKLASVPKKGHFSVGKSSKPSSTGDRHKSMAQSADETVEGKVCPHTSS